MIRNKTLALAFAGVLAIGGTGVLYAQDQHEGMGMMGKMAPCPMMHAAAEGPSAMLEHSDTLQLTAEQTRGLESIRDELAEARRMGMEAMLEMGVASLEARREALEILNAPQRETFAELSTGSMQGMQGMHGTMNMMSECPMMQGETAAGSRQRMMGAGQEGVR